MLLRVPPFRGAQVAAGVVVLATLALLLELRMEDWPAGARLACSGGLAVLVWALVIGTPSAEGQARPWLAALCLSAVVLLALALGHVLDLLGEDGWYGTAGDDTPWAGLAGCTLLILLAAAWCARERAAASCAFVAGVAGTGLLLLCRAWISEPSGQTLRWLLALSAFVLLVLTLVQRDVRPQHAAQLANAGGLAVLAIAQTAGVGPVFFLVFFEEQPQLGAGWDLLLLAAGFGLMAYGAVDGHRGPVVFGILNTVAFVVATGFNGGFVGWPLVLLLAGVALLVIGLRPTTPAPPEPGSDDELAPAIEVRLDG